MMTVGNRHDVPCFYPILKSSHTQSILTYYCYHHFTKYPAETCRIFYPLCSLFHDHLHTDVNPWNTMPTFTTFSHHGFFLILKWSKLYSIQFLQQQIIQRELKKLCHHHTTITCHVLRAMYVVWSNEYRHEQLAGKRQGWRSRSSLQNNCSRKKEKQAFCDCSACDDKMGA